MERESEYEDANDEQADDLDELDDPSAESDSGESGSRATISQDSQSPSSESKSAKPGKLGKLLVRFIDVGQGDCALISCDDEYMLIDGGPPYASSKIYAILKNLGVDHLKYIIATHPDADHIGGISGALNYASCGVCYCSVEEGQTDTFKSMKKYLERKGSKITVPKAGQDFQLGEATVTFVGPVRELEEANNNSLVCRLDFGTTSFMFTGDAEFKEEATLVSAGYNLEADVLKVAHHGSAYSSTSTFVDAVSPDYAVISVGPNDYGHPSQEVIDLLERRGATVLRTDELGSIVFSSDGRELSYASKGVIDE